MAQLGSTGKTEDSIVIQALGGQGCQWLLEEKKKNADQWIKEGGKQGNDGSTDVRGPPCEQDITATQQRIDNEDKSYNSKCGMRVCSNES
ncbi:MAG: hypothetical protein ACREA9_23135 [Pyrinomonadaceae bacterium]